MRAVDACPPLAALDLLKTKGCKIGGVTMGERGMLWYDENGRSLDDAGAFRAGR